MYGNLFNKIEGVAAIATVKDETWVSLSLSGQYRQQYSKTLFTELNGALDDLGKAGCITYQIGNAVVALEELQETLVNNVQWSVSINKQAFMGDGEEICNFFYDLDAFNTWSENSDPFSNNYPLNSHRCKIEVRGLHNSFGGQNFLVSDNIREIPSETGLTYKHDHLKSILRQFTETKWEVHPERHYVSFGEVDDNSKHFFRNSLMCLSVALCDELYEDKVVLRGIRRLEFRLQATNYEVGQLAQAQESLSNAFCWIYCDDSRFELRHKLLMDRLTLDMPFDPSYYQGVISLIDDALQQAKERYNYAFFERSNEYQKELQQFLKELHGLCDSYSVKVRSLLGSFLRDALAGFLTVAISIFARVRDLEKLDMANVLRYIFCAYGIYLLISCLFQAIVDWRDLYLSEKEIDYWKSVSREYMREEDFKAHKKGTVNKRRNWAIRQYIYVGLLYITFAVFCFNVPKLWNKLSMVKETAESSKDSSKAETNSVNTIKFENIQDGTDALSGNGDTKVCNTPCGKQK